MPDLADFNAEAALRRLKAFQRWTVEYVFRRMYEDDDCVRHFLVADEVGLGKTMVARGMIAKVIEHLRDEVERIDILYICSNQAIAQQNINRLNVLGHNALSLPTRMTLLPLQLTGQGGLTSNKVNFISLTPGTTFELRSSTGISPERALLSRMLAGMVEPKRGLINMFQVGAGPAGWQRTLDRVAEAELDADLVGKFQVRVHEEAGLLDELVELCEAFHERRSSYPPEMTSPRNRVIGRLRSLLAQTCVEVLEPDLIILDEFQRFTGLLHGDTVAAELAKELFDYTDQSGSKARTLLLSATPYRMLTLSGDSEEEGHHYEDFLKTLSFLFGKERGQQRAEELSHEIERFRRSLLSLPGGREAALGQKEVIEARLRSVMSRTERVPNTAERNAMVVEAALPVSVEPDDLRQAAFISAVADAAEAPGIVEYWKSSPYLLNFMRDYALKRALKSEDRAAQPAIVDAVRQALPTCLQRQDIDAYRPLEPANGRMRALLNDIFADSLDQHLWMPPSLPYYGEGPTKPPSKALVFSSWAMVPDAVAAVLSYEAERRMGVGRAGMNYFDRVRPRLLQFRETQGRLAGLRAVLLVYPSPEIAAADPLDIVAEHSGRLSYEEMRAALAERLRPLLRRLQSVSDAEAEPNTWDWAGPAVLDALAGKATTDWLASKDGLVYLGEEEAWPDHVSALHMAAVGGRISGAVNDEALDLLVDIALGSPAICALRALRRIAPDLAWDNSHLLSAAGWIAWGFRTLYNQHDTVALLRQEREDRYWHSAIVHGARHNLQAVLDEYVHCLVEAEGLTDMPPEERVGKLSDAINAVLSLRPSQIDVDDPRTEDNRVQIGSFTMRGRFAMRLSDYRDEEGEAARVTGVRDAFNSPFRPFVLATTSIGQEGLDFHPYCHRIYHWNLPPNPVDLEQREGRIHRYKGHAIRLNVAEKHVAKIRGCGSAPADPWAEMFADARAGADIQSDLVPYWIYDGSHKVERRVPMLPYSREVSRLKWLKKSVAVYRLAFGQPRQDDLLAFLEGLVDTTGDPDLGELQIRLSPPEF